MKIIPTEIPDVMIVEPRVFGDERGFFFESFNAKVFQDKTGLTVDFVQDNHSRSSAHVLRGLHYQIQQAQGKLVRVVAGAIFDVAVDIRKSSPTFGQWVGCELSAENKQQLWVPPGFAHGFLSLVDGTEVLYKATHFYAPEYERSILWNDADLAIAWPLSATPIISGKDQVGQPFSEAEVYV
ncbi:MAG: dTDP-4-dehydrorhamnose 3,5-epimerase [Elainella sp. Prado103]|nr:dTDP-4-dehydrorhamnose 3,5-epimerase [Elainella sp. Prado103]